MTGLVVDQVTVSFGRGRRAVPVLREVDLTVPSGTTLGIVGESGSGKSTLARVVAGVISPSSGTISLGGETFGTRRSRRAYRRIQLAFQDPGTALNPRLTVEQTLADACGAPPGRAAARIGELLEAVGLDDGHRRARPRDLSGGQRQRVSLARALAVEPEVLICDEVTSALDVSTRAMILNLVVDLQRRRRFTLLFISHDIGAVRRVTERVAVMYAGQVVEVASTTAISTAPTHPYTKVLLAAVPSLDLGRRPVPVDFEPVDPRHPPSGCRFHPRCPTGPRSGTAPVACETEDPIVGARLRVNQAACHLAPPAPEPLDQPGSATTQPQI